MHETVILFILLVLVCGAGFYLAYKLGRYREQLDHYRAERSDVADGKRESEDAAENVARAVDSIREKLSEIRKESHAMAGGGSDGLDSGSPGIDRDDSGNCDEVAEDKAE